MKKFTIITLFPKSIEGYLKSSILGRAEKAGLASFEILNPRNFTEDKHHVTDDKPFGGGPGMVMKAEPILKAVESCNVNHLARDVKTKKLEPKTKIVLTSATGKQFTKEMAKIWAKKYDNFIFIAGRYEGVDERVRKILKAEEISIGHYILTGGELPAVVMIDAVSRHISGVLGNEESLEENRLAGLPLPKALPAGNRSSSGKEGGFGIPQYTRPEVIEWKSKKYSVPKVLMQGNHKKINNWRVLNGSK